MEASGKIAYFVSEEKKFIRKVTKGGDATIEFERIKKIGEDVILVDI